MKIETYQQMPLRAHDLLADVPLRTLERIELPGGRAAMTLADISEVIGFGSEEEVKISPITNALFWLRGLIGRIFHWDEVPDLVATNSFISRLSEEDRCHSLVTPGKPSGISRILYQFEHEMLGEIINRTVHCFWLLASEGTANGYVLWLAIYVKKINWFTPIYMALITPMLKWIIYPAMLKNIRQRWAQAFPALQKSRALPPDLKGRIA